MTVCDSAPVFRVRDSFLHDVHLFTPRCKSLNGAFPSRVRRNSLWQDVAPVPDLDTENVSTELPVFKSIPNCNECFHASMILCYPALVKGIYVYNSLLLSIHMRRTAILSLVYCLWFTKRTFAKMFRFCLRRPATAVHARRINPDLHQVHRPPSQADTPHNEPPLLSPG